ncbi:MAG: agarase [Bacteroidetes bacterium]|nr:agarase [Bacteroidota bacterium]
MRILTINIFLFLCLLISISCHTQKKSFTPENKVVETKKWSKVNGEVKYSDWVKCNATTIDQLPGFKSEKEAEFSRFGGDLATKENSTGYYYTKKIGSKWWIIDPDGYGCWNVAMNGVRPGNSERNESALISRYTTPEKWILKTEKDLLEMGFNGAGCWSDTRLIQYANKENAQSLSYTLISNFYANYSRQRKKIKTDDISFAVFDPAFLASCEEQAQKLSETSSDPNLFGHFSDNELPFNEKILDEYLACKDESDPNHQAALSWLKSLGISQNQLTNDNRQAFLGFVAEKYFSIASEAIRKFDPNHLYLGSRLHGKPKHTESIVKAAGKYCDIISINYYGQWEPAQKHFDQWKSWADKPVLITEFYTKGDDSGMANNSGAGWRVKTQDDRGIFYENFCLKLLRMDNCVGWNWFRYMDNDPTDETADPSNNDSNKGIVNNLYEYYTPLINHMQRLNLNRYRLIRYFKKNEING